MNKSEIRKKIFKLRKKNSSQSLILNLNKIFQFLREKDIKKKIIGGYYPYNYEFDILGILKELEKKKYIVSLPKINKNNKMDFFQWSLNDPLLINSYGIPEPINKIKVYPEVLLIPLVAFDNNLNRLGYGGGYYDRYISKIEKVHKIIKIGVGFSFQKIGKLPTNKYDKKLDFVLTEKNFI